MAGAKIITDVIGDALRLAGKEAPEAASGIRAYHGSPHDFDEFDLSRIGTGEGAQAYGHGLYFAESEPIARYYRDKLTGSPTEVMFSGERYHPDALSGLEADAARAALTYDSPLGWRQYLSRYHDEDQVKKALSLLESGAMEVAPSGRMYEVNINATPEHLLDWDKPFSSVDDLERFAAKFDAVNPELRRRIEDYGFFRQQSDMPMPDGNDLMREVFGGVNNIPAQQSSAMMSEAGIPGIRYLDANSRGFGEGTSNYVIFEPSIIDIIRKYANGGRIEKAGAGKVIGEALDLAKKLTLEDVFEFDNPGGSWLASKQEQAEQAMRDFDPRTAHGKGLVGSATAYTIDPHEFDAGFLKTIPGSYDERRIPGDLKFDRLRKDVEKQGWNPGPIMVSVNHKGEPFIYEGNTRTAVANYLGIPTIPAEVRFLNGGENVMGDYTPDVFLEHLREGYVKNQGGAVEDQDADIEAALMTAYANGGRIAKGGAGAVVKKLAKSSPEELLKAAAAPTRRTFSDLANLGLEQTAYESKLAGKKPLEDYSVVLQDKGTLQPWQEADLEALVREGAVIYPALGDRSAAGKFVNEIGGRQLTKPVNLQGGGDFGRSEFGIGDNPAFWASRKAAANKMIRKIIMGANDGPAYMTHVAMGYPNLDSTHMVNQSIVRAIPASNVSKKNMDKLNAAARAMQPDFPGFENVEEAEAFLASLPGAKASDIMKLFSKGAAHQADLPNLYETRWAVSEPRLMDIEPLTAGYSIGQVKPGGAVPKGGFEHETYDTKIPLVGEVSGLSTPVPASVMFPDWWSQLSNAAQSGQVQQQQHLMMMMFPQQKATQQWLDSIRAYQEANPGKFGYAEGGAVDDMDADIEAALMTARNEKADGGGSEYPSLENIPSYEEASAAQAEQNAINAYEDWKYNNWGDPADIVAYSSSHPGAMSPEKQKEMLMRAYQMERPETPTRPVTIDMPLLGGEYELGDARYDVADRLSGLGQLAYDLKTIPGYVAGSVFPPAAIAAEGIDLAEAAASEDPAQFAAAIAFGPYGKYTKAGVLGGMAALSPEDANAIIFGKNAKLTSELSDALALAQDMKKQGAGIDEVWDATKWYAAPATRGYGDVWQSYADPKNMKYDPYHKYSDTPVAMPDLIDWPELYDLYPGLKDYTVLPNDPAIPAGEGWQRRKNKEIGIGKMPVKWQGLVGNYRTTDPWGHTLTHELQHAGLFEDLAHSEAMGNPSPAYLRWAMGENPDLSIGRAKALAKIHGTNITRTINKQNPTLAAMKFYYANPGEELARNAAYRYDYPKLRDLPIPVSSDLARPPMTFTPLSSPDELRAAAKMSLEDVDNISNYGTVNYDRPGYTYPDGSIPNSNKDRQW